MIPHRSKLVLVLLATFLLASGPAPEPSATLVLGGDVQFGRWVQDDYRETARPAEDEELRSRFATADLALVNLETAICDDERARATSPLFADQPNRFTAEPRALTWLVELGVDVAVVANNHSLDCGPDSLEHTIAHLDEVDIAAAGAEAPTELSIGDYPVLVVAVTAHPPRINPGDQTSPNIVWNRSASRRALLSEVTELRADNRDALIIVSLHWGTELATEPSAAQRRLARNLLDAGADLIYGHGPHVLQEVEHHGPGAIVYSTGNLRFDMTTRATLLPGLIELDLFHVTSAKAETPWRIRLRGTDPGDALRE